MASKEKTSSENVPEQQQSVVDRDKVKQDREARRLAKLKSKQKLQDKSRNLSSPPDDEKVANLQKNSPPKQTGKQVVSPKSTSPKVGSNATDRNSHRKEQNQRTEPNRTEKPSAERLANNMQTMNISSDSKQPKSESFEKPEKKQLTKAERRAIQEQQRAAKAATQATKKDSNESKPGQSIKTKSDNTPSKSNVSITGLSANKRSSSRPQPRLQSLQHRVKLFNHLYVDVGKDTPLNSPDIHPAIIRLGVPYSSGVVKGCNARGLAFMNAMKSVIKEYETPSQKEFARGLEDVIKTCGNHLQKCRPLAISVTNAMKFIQFQLRQFGKKSETDAVQKFQLIDHIDTYVRDQMDKATESICATVQQKISDGDVILTFGYSSVILNILKSAIDSEKAKNGKLNFRVIVVDARPWHEGKEMLRRLVAHKIKNTCVLINAAGFIMPEVTKVLLGAHALLANGYVMSRAGTAQIALIAKSYNVPVLVCCETHKFSERVQTDAFVYNEIGDPNDIVKYNENNSQLANWESIPNLTPLNLYYDVTPPELVSAVVTEVAILPCTSVPVILRIKPSDGY